MLKEWLLAWSTGPGQVKHIQVHTQEAGLDRAESINAPRRVRQPDGTYKVRYPDIGWSVICRNSPANQKALGIFSRGH